MLSWLHPSQEEKNQVKAVARCRVVFISQPLWLVSSLQVFWSRHFKYNCQMVSVMARYSKSV